MKRIDLILQKHDVIIGDKCPYIEPNVTEDCIFYENGEPIGFYLTKMPEKMCKLADLANVEFRSTRVKKQMIKRVNMKEQIIDGKIIRTDRYAKKSGEEVKQFSTQLGSVPPKPQFGRPYATKMQIHSNEKAQTFIKAMLMLANESEKLIKEILPNQYKQQIELLKDVSDKWKFSNLFTGSISNYNVSVPFHQDKLNIIGTVNVIICKKHNSKGGDLHIPDYNATIGQQDNSILVYPAWKNIHGVTPIIPTHDGGYRNSLVFYPLKAFIGLK